MLFYLSYFISAWLMPPGCVLLLALIALLFWRKWPMPGKAALSMAFICLWLLSSPLIAQKLIDGLQYQYPSLSPGQLAPDKSSAIVVLEAGLNLVTPEYGEPGVSESTLTRLRYAAFLYGKLRAPIMVSGNDPSQPTINQAEWMAHALTQYFNVPTKWKEDKGYNTALEGKYTAEIMKENGVSRIYLVTHAFHMPRSVQAFQNKGLQVIPAPTGYISAKENMGSLSLVLPSSQALTMSTMALHEYIGILWYRLHYRL